MIEYIELHCHSYFSLLDGASTISDLLLGASQLGLPALALTDHDNVYGAVSFQKQAKAVGIKPIFGSELTLDTGHHLTLLVQNQQGWENLCYLITQAQHNADKGEAFLNRDCLIDHTNGLIGLSGCRHGEISSRVINRQYDKLDDTVGWYVDVFGQGKLLYRATASPSTG